MTGATAERWAPEHVVAMAPDVAAAAAGRTMAVPSRWAATGADVEAVWGLCRGSGAEPYQVAVELAEPAYRCTCPSRKLPCKHALGLLLLWANGHVAEAARPLFVGEWVARRAARTAASAARDADPGGDPPDDAELDLGPAAARRVTRAANGGDHPEGAGKPDKRAMERAARVAAGLAELDRWVADRVRGGLTDPALASYATWDQVAARLVDAQAPALANRVRRLAGAVGTRPGWHEHVLAEFGVLHVLAVAGRRVADLAAADTDDDHDDNHGGWPAPGARGVGGDGLDGSGAALADSVRTAVGWQLRQADVLDRPPVTDTWHVCGRSDVLEDRIVVRRTWLRGVTTRRWALLLSFAAYGQSLGGEPVPGTLLRADLHSYPGAVPLRALIGVVHESGALDESGPPASTVVEACAGVGAALAAELWLERHPFTVRAAPTFAGQGWALTDAGGSLPIAGTPDGLAVLVACTGGRPASITAEWTPEGVVPLTVHLPSGAVDVGPRGGWR